MELETKTKSIYYKTFEQKVIKKATMYFNMIRIKSKAYPDPGLAAFHLWTKVAIPSILYGVDATDLSKTTWNQLTSIHHKIGKYILQVPYNTQNVCALIAYGLEPLHILHMDKIHSLATRLYASVSPLVMECMQTMKTQGDKNLFYKQVIMLEKGRRVGEEYVDCRKRNLQVYLLEETERVKETTFYFLPIGSVEKRLFMKLTPERQKIQNRFLFMNAGLGNRAPSECGVRMKECLGCRLIFGKYARMNEVHLLLHCPRYIHTRRLLGIYELIQELNSRYTTPEEAYNKFWGKNLLITRDELSWRTDCAEMMKEVYLKDVPLMKQVLRRYYVIFMYGE